MSFDLYEPTPAAGPTREELASQQAEILRISTGGALVSFVSAINEGRKRFWENRDGFTPGEMAAALGPECGALFAKNIAVERFLGQVFPKAAGMLWQPPYANYVVTSHDDGRITIEPVPPVPSPEE